jgi:hypothetical protein
LIQERIRASQNNRHTSTSGTWQQPDLPQGPLGEDPAKISTRFPDKNQYKVTRKPFREDFTEISTKNSRHHARTPLDDVSRIFTTFFDKKLCHHGMIFFPTLANVVALRRKGGCLAQGRKKCPIPGTCQGEERSRLQNVREKNIVRYEKMKHDS